MPNLYHELIHVKCLAQWLVHSEYAILSIIIFFIAVITRWIPCPGFGSDMLCPFVLPCGELLPCPQSPEGSEAWAYWPMAKEWVVDRSSGTPSLPD